MDTSETKLEIVTELREINRASARSIAGPKQFDITRKGQEPDAAPYRPSAKNKKYAVWGKDNRYPADVVDANISDTTSSACLKFKISAHYGKGLFIYKNEVTPDGKESKVPLSLNDPKYKEIKEFFLLNDVENIQQAIITDFEWWNWYVVEFIPGSNEGKKKIAQVNRIPVVNSRLEIQDADTGKINNIYVSGEFGGKIDPNNAKPIPIMTRRDSYDEKFELKSKRAFIARQISVDRQYYPFPAWQSNNKFLNLSLEISDWILSNINNSMNIKYHVKYPKSYFENLHPGAAYKTEEERISAIKTEKSTLFTSLDEVLSGTSNAGKYFQSAVDVNPMKPDMGIGFEIIPIKNETNHDAYLPAFDTSAAAIANAHNAPLDLVGISLSKGMGGSGSNIRESFNFYMQLHTEIPRQTTLEWLYVAKKIQGWPEEVEFGYRNIVFQSVNENKSGYAVENEANPTTDKK